MVPLLLRRRHRSMQQVVGHDEERCDADANAKLTQSADFL